MKLIKYFVIILVLSLSMFVVNPVLAVDDSSLGGLNTTAGKIGAYQQQVNTASVINVVLDRVGGIVGLILSFVGVIFLILTVYAGIMWMTAQGNASQVDKAKDLLINAIIGLVIVSAAYSITTFVGTNLAK